jgi:hypothetical protein
MPLRSKAILSILEFEFFPLGATQRVLASCYPLQALEPFHGLTHLRKLATGRAEGVCGCLNVVTQRSVFQLRIQSLSFDCGDFSAQAKEFDGMKRWPRTAQRVGLLFQGGNRLLTLVQTVDGRALFGYAP